MPNFSALVGHQARTVLTLLGGATWLYTDTTQTDTDVLAKIEKDVEVTANSGLSIMRADVAHILKADVGTVLRLGTLTLDGATYTVQDVIEDDGFIIQARVSK